MGPVGAQGRCAVYPYAPNASVLRILLRPRPLRCPPFGAQHVELDVLRVGVEHVVRLG